MSKGFVIMAQNTDTVDYVECANQLSDSIKRCMPDANITIIKTSDLPYGDMGGQANDWQVYDASPYEHTIKLEADMIIPVSIDYWWDILVERDIVVCSSIRNYKGEISQVRDYRRFIDDNKLPDVYNAITYFKKGDTAKQFFDLVKNVFTFWDDWKKILKCNKDEEASTDWVYAIVCHLMGKEITTLPTAPISMVHMKKYVNDLSIEDWTNELVYEFDELRINTIPQRYPFHYYIKDFSKELKKHYG